MTDPALAEPPPDPRPSRIEAHLHELGRPAMRLLLVVVLFVALLPAQCMISDLIGEREARQEEVRREVGSAWGKPQSVLGPVLRVPTRVPNAEPGTPRGTLALLPSQVEVRTVIEPETRRRGIFSAIVYRARVEMRGSFVLPPAGGEPLRDWQDAVLLLGASDLRMTPSEPVLDFAGRRMGEAEAEGETGCRTFDWLRWPLALEAPPEPGRPIPFTASLELRGTSFFRLLATARRTSLEVTSPWPSPSFAGSDLPLRSEVGEAGFQAQWLAASRLVPVQHGAGWCAAVLAGSSDGLQVSLLEAVPTYRMVNRAAKYAALVLALALLTYVLFEMLAKVAIHPVQYALLGLSVTLFPLLLLAIGEPLGYGAAFAIAAAMVTAQAGAYTAMVTRRRGLALVFAAALSGMFGFVHVVLSLESYALLAGAVALFAALSLLMAVTRRVRWGGT
jgi:inner membrane protein